MILSSIPTNPQNCNEYTRHGKFNFPHHRFDRLCSRVSHVLLLRFVILSPWGKPSPLYAIFLYSTEHFANCDNVQWKYMYPTLIDTGFRFWKTKNVIFCHLDSLKRIRQTSKALTKVSRYSISWMCGFPIDHHRSHSKRRWRVSHSKTDRIAVKWNS